jgi:hypothetical protein
MAAKLATIDWHVLSCERADLPSGPTYSGELMKNAQAIWKHFLVIGENRYRVSSSSTDVDEAWQKILGKLFGENRQAA